MPLVFIGQPQNGPQESISIGNQLEAQFCDAALPRGGSLGEISSENFSKRILLSLRSGCISSILVERIRYQILSLSRPPFLALQEAQKSIWSPITVNT